MITQELQDPGIRYKGAVLAGVISTVLAFLPVWVYLLALDHLLHVLLDPALVVVEFAGSLVFGSLDLFLVILLRISGAGRWGMPLLFCIPALGVLLVGGTMCIVLP